MSLISLYTDLLEANNVKYDIIYMDKYGEVEKFGAEIIYRYENIVEKKWGKARKAFQYTRFYFYARKILNRKKYDFIIVWNDVAIFLFSHFLSRRYAQKYCLNIRDYFGEKNSFVFSIFRQGINRASFATISSEGFLDFLPEHNYMTIYSFNKSALSSCKPRLNLRNHDMALRIGFIGNVRFYDINKLLIDVFGNDKRFELHFYGVNAEILKKYAKEKEINNVVCMNSFPVEQTGELLNNIDIINNLYGYGCVELDTALSIKLFHAAFMNVPIMVFKKTYMQVISERFGLGYAIEQITSELPDQLYKWYHSMNFDSLRNGCESLIDLAVTKNKEFEEVVIRKIL